MITTRLTFPHMPTIVLHKSTKAEKDLAVFSEAYPDTTYTNNNPPDLLLLSDSFLPFQYDFLAGLALC